MYTPPKKCRGTWVGGLKTVSVLNVFILVTLSTHPRGQVYIVFTNVCAFLYDSTVVCCYEFGRCMQRKRKNSIIKFSRKNVTWHYLYTPDMNEHGNGQRYEKLKKRKTQATVHDDNNMFELIAKAIEKEVRSIHPVFIAQFLNKSFYILFV